MKTGIIMEINERFLTLLTPEGEFLRARKQDRAYAIGQEIDFFPIEQKSGKKSSSLSIFNALRGKAVFAAAFALMLAVVSFLPFYQSNEVYAYMSIDVNPSIELGVNEKYQVIELVPFNEDGERIVQKIEDWKKEDIQSVIDKILDQLKEQGYLGENKEIVIATVYTEDNIETDKRMQAELTEIREAVQEEHLEVMVFEGTQKEREAAIEKGLTTGLYKENKLKTDNKKSTEKEKTTSANQPKEIDSSSKPAETPPGQLKKQEKPAENQGKLDENKEKTAIPGQTKKNEMQEDKQNSSQKNNGKNDKEYRSKESSEKRNNEKKNNQNERTKNNGNQSSNRHSNGSSWNVNNSEKPLKENSNKK